MKYSVIPTTTFLRKVKYLIKKYPHIKNDIDELSEALSQNPELGTVIPKTPGVRKIRWDNSDAKRGKRGGYRIIYLTYREEYEVYLLTIYSKSEQADIPSKDILYILHQEGFIH